MFGSVQGGYMGNAGAPGTTIAGTWIRDPFPQGQQTEVDQLWRRGMQETEKGRQMQENIQRLRQTLPQAMGMPGMNIGNMAGMPAAADPSSRYLQQPNRNTQGVNTGRRQESETAQEPEETQNPFLSGTLNPFSGYMRALANMQNTAKEAGFDRKTVS